MKLINKPSNMTLRSFLIFLLSSLILAGCSSVPESVTSVEWQAHEQRLETIHDFQATGKLGYIGPDQRQSLNFFLEALHRFKPTSINHCLGTNRIKTNDYPTRGNG